MLYILTFIFTIALDNFLQINVISPEKNLLLYLPVSLINYAEISQVMADDIDQLLSEGDVEKGDTLADIEAGEERMVIVILPKDDVMERGNRVPEKFRIEIEDKGEGKASIILPLWSFDIFSKLGGILLGDIDTVFVEALSKSLEEMGGGRFKILEAYDSESLVKIYVE